MRKNITPAWDINPCFDTGQANPAIYCSGLAAELIHYLLLCTYLFKVQAL